MPREQENGPINQKIENPKPSKNTAISTNNISLITVTPVVFGLQFIVILLETTVLDREVL